MHSYILRTDRKKTAALLQPLVIKQNMVPFRGRISSCLYRSRPGSATGLRGDTTFRYVRVVPVTAKSPGGWESQIVFGPKKGGV